MKILNVLLLCLFTAGIINAQEKHEPMLYSDVKEASKVYSLNLDDHQNEFQSFFKKIHLFTSLSHLEISNYDQIYFPEDIKMLGITSLTINNSQDVDFSSLFKLLAAMPKLKTLILDGNDLSVLPLQPILFKNLHEFHLRNNESIDLSPLNLAIQNMDSLKSLNLSDNQLTNCPSQLSQLTALRCLDISNNNLKTLPIEIENLKNLDSLWIQGNTFKDIKEQLLLLKKNTLKYLSIDEIVDETNRTWIYKNFPGIELNEDVSEGVDLSLSLERVPVSQRSSMKNNSTQYGRISIVGKEFQALSNAYYHYPKLFNNRQFVYTYDSLLLEERYLDTNYALASKLDSNKSYHWVKIYKKISLFNKDIYFNIYPKKPMSFYENFPELRAFASMKWKYTGVLSSRAFKYKYIENKDWLDIRIYFDEENKKFTLELKRKSGFTELEAIPIERIHMKPKALLQYSEKHYLNRYLRYVKSLDTKKRRFHSLMLRGKKRYEKNMQNSIKKTWKDFRRVYMSAEEKKMSKAEWLLYYDKLVANEKKALASAQTNVKSLSRSLELEKYLLNNFSNLVNSGYSTSHVSFVNAKKENLAVLSFMVIDLEDRSYYAYDGNLGIDKQSIYLKNSNLVLVAELRNGDIAYLDQYAAKQMRFNADEEVEIQMNIIEKGLSTVGQMYQLLKL